MRIAICDDEREQREYLGSLVEKWSQKNNIKAEIREFPSAESFLFEYAPEQFQLLLLDIQMGGEDGVTLARELREKDSKIQIVFITALSEYISEGYEVSALHYLIKPVREDKLFSCLERAKSNVADAKSPVILTQNGERICLFENDIEAVEAVSHNSVIYKSDGKITVSESFGEIKEMLSEDFFQCHRSYLVHLGHIERILKQELILDCKEQIPVSRRLYKELNDSFINYHMRGRK